MTPFLQVMVNEIVGMNGDVELDPAAVEETVKDAVKEAVKEAVKTSWRMRWNKTARRFSPNERPYRLAVVMRVRVAAFRPEFAGYVRARVDSQQNSAGSGSARHGMKAGRHP